MKNGFMNIIRITLLLLFISSCTSHQDETKKKAILAYALDCRGGTTVACQATCNSICGVASDTEALTSSTVTCIYNCKTSCTSSCNVLTLYTTLSRKP